MAEGKGRETCKMMSSIAKFVDKYFGLQVEEIFALDGYDDLNMKLSLKGHPNLILKLTGYTDESQIEFIELQHRIMGYLKNHGIPVPEVIATSTGGNKWATLCLPATAEDVGDVEYVCQVLSYLPGKTMFSAGNPGHLLEGVGRLAGQVDKLLQKFSAGCVPERRNTLWELSRAHAIEPLLEKYCPAHIQKLGHGVLYCYSEKVVPRLPLMQKGYIHGDINNCNILVQKDCLKPDSEYQISGLLDFGDLCYSYYIYEIAIVMGDLMSSCLSSRDALLVARSVLCGYRKEFNLHEEELNCLKIVICVRLLQLYVLRFVDKSSETGNGYRDLECEENLEVCKRLYDIDDESFIIKVVKTTGT